MVSKNLPETSSKASEICKFYAGKTIFITGAAGFLGTVLLESLLRCCPDISRIYILLRSKKGVEAEDRKNLIFEKDIFVEIKSTNPDVLEKVKVVSGDISQENLGLSENDFKNLTQEVSVVFHVAAAISFSKPLSFTLRQNVVATNYMIDFCRKTVKLEVLVYTSSVYSCCNHKSVIEEKIYDLPFQAEKIIKSLRNDNEDDLMKFFQMCTPPYPNFYTFSKCVAENLLKEKAHDLPVCIIRPSIIGNCLKGPLPGYVEGGSAIVSLPLVIGKGLVRVMLIDTSKRCEIIPADVVANSHIIGAFQQVSESLSSPSVFNCVSGKEADYSWGEFVVNLLSMVKKDPLPESFVEPFLITCKNPMLYKILCLLLHYIPAVTIDLFLWISGSHFRLIKIYKLYDKAMKSVEYFGMNEWDMENKKFLSLSKGLNALEEKMFSIDLKHSTLQEVTRTLRAGSFIYRIDGKRYKDNFKWKSLRWFVTSFLLVFHLGILALILHLVFYKMWY